MRAAVCSSYGSPEVVSVAEVEDPEPGETDLLIRVEHSTVNRTDAAVRSATPPILSRLGYGLRRPRRQVLGTDFAGVVVEMGDEVRGFSVGDRVFGFDDRRMGGHGERLAIPASAAVALIPDDVASEVAAASVEGAHYALTYIDQASLDQGSRVVVFGGGGAIGSAAVQLWAAAGAEVTVVARPDQLDLMRELGATTAVDSLDDVDGDFDLVFDAVGHTRFRHCRRLLGDSGMFMATELGPRMENVWLALTTKFRGPHRVYFPIPSATRAHVHAIAEHLSSGRFRPVIDRVVDLDDIVEAYRYVDSAAKTGNVVLRVSPSLDTEG